MINKITVTAVQLGIFNCSCAVLGTAVLNKMENFKSYNNINNSINFQKYKQCSTLWAVRPITE